MTDITDQNTSIAPTATDFEEVVEDESQVKTKKSSSIDSEVAESNETAQVLMSLQNLVERNANELDRLRNQIKELRQSLKSVFDNDQGLTEAEQVAQEVATKVKERKQSIDAQPEVRQLKLKIADTREEMKEIEETLNSHLISLFKMTGTQSFDTSDGDQREFTLKAKVMSKGKKASDDKDEM